MLNTGVSLQRLATKAGVGFTPKKLFSNGEAGVWYDPSDVEASLTWRRNLLEYTESFDNSYWQGYFGKPSLTTGQADPLGGNNAIKWNASTTTGGGTGDKGGFYRDDFDGIMKQNTDYTVSVWLKASTSVALLLSLNDGPSTSLSVTTEWQRFSVTTQLSSNPAHGARVFQIVDATNADVDIYIFGAQTEEGSTATEYQPIRSTFDNAFKQAFPKHTLYQNHSGRTPVTSLGQAVGLMLDKSRGLQLGDELVTNGDFSNGATGWTAENGATANVVGGELVVSDGAGLYSRVRQDILMPTGNHSYILTVDAKVGTGTSFDIRIGNNTGSQTYGSYTGVTSTSKQQYSLIFTPTPNTQIYLFLYSNDSDNGGTAIFDNVSIKQLSGSHATQSDSTKRPVFARHPERGRVNLFKYTEEFDNGYWTKLVSATVTANAGVAPNGTQTADRISLAADPISRVERQLNVENNKQLIFSIYLKSESGNKSVRLGVSTYTGLQTVTVTETWQRFTFAFTETDGVTYPRIQNTSSTAQDILAWGAQVEYANEATGYQKVVDDYDITESGYKSVYYLQFDGINDGMQINNLTSSSTPLTALFGVELNANNKWLLDIQNGRTVFGGNSSDHSIYDGSWINGEPEVLNTPIVLTYDAVQSDLKMRINGIVETTSSAYDENAIGGSIGLFQAFTQNGSYVNGNMYQVVLRAAESTDKEIDQAEEFVAIKTGLKSEVVGLATLDLNFGANTYTARNSNGSVL